MPESAGQFIARKSAHWESQRGKKSLMKGVGRGGRHCWVRQAWTLMVQSNLREKVFVIERLEYVGYLRTDGSRAYRGGARLGDQEYRFGYYTIGRTGRAQGRWTWGQFCR